VLTGTGPDDTGPVATFARRRGHALLPAALVRQPSFASRVDEHGVDVLVNVHYLHIVVSEVLQAPRIGAFNLHPGPLPAYTGLNAPSWAIYNGEREHAATVHWMEPEVDTGPIAAEATFAIADDETGLSLSGRCVQAGVPLMLEVLEAADLDPAAIPARPQVGSRRVYGRRPPQDGLIEWSRPAREIHAFVRAADFSPLRSPWGHPAITGDRRLKAVRSALTGVECSEPPGTVARVEPGNAWVATGDDWLVLSRLVANGAVVNAHEVLRAGQRLGR
jgi:methionyl-tRNA formyltransferase